MTLPAAAVPWSPCSRMSLVEATFRARRSSVVTSRTDGKIENSRGEVMNIDVIRMTSEKEMEKARRTSRMMVGRRHQHDKEGHDTPPARRMSPWRVKRL
jgi:hypothetical protein